MSHIPLYFYSVGIMMHIISCYVLLEAYELGIVGIGLANCGTMLIIYAGSVIYSAYIPSIAPAIQSISSNSF